MQRNSLIAIAAVVALVAGAYAWNSSREADQQTASAGVDQKPLVDVAVPDLTEAETLGRNAFNATCAACHGANAAGKDGAGPPLVHKIYEPGHHGDAAFFLAAQNGVRAHHWPFGDMPPVAGITQGEVKSIVAYVRALQRANGIN